MTCTLDKRLCVFYTFVLNYDKICALLGYYAALNGNSVTMFWNDLSVPSTEVRCLGENFSYKSLQNETHYAQSTSSISIVIFLETKQMFFFFVILILNKENCVRLNLL